MSKTFGQLEQALRATGAWVQGESHEDGTLILYGGVTVDQYGRGDYSGGRFYARYSGQMFKERKIDTWFVKSPRGIEVTGINPDEMIEQVRFSAAQFGGTR